MLRGFLAGQSAEGTSALALVRFYYLHGAHAWIDTRVLHIVRTTTTTTTPHPTLPPHTPSPTTTTTPFSLSSSSPNTTPHTPPPPPPQPTPPHPPPPPKPFLARVPWFLLCAWKQLQAVDMMNVDSGTAAARRLHSLLRHERMTVAVTLSEMTHHTAPRGLRVARVGEEVENATHDGSRAQKSTPPGERPECRCHCETISICGEKLPLAVTPSHRSSIFGCTSGHTTELMHVARQHRTVRVLWSQR